MKRSVSVLCALLLLLSVACLTACGGKDISGTYKLVEMTSGGEDMTKYIGMIDEVTLTVDGSKAKLEMGEDVSELIVDTKTQTVKTDGSSSPYTVEGNKLTLEDESSKTKMVFEKQK